MNDMITISREEYDRLIEAEHDLDDLRAYDRAMAAIAAGEDDLIPSEFAHRLLDGESPLRVWRELRGFTQTQLAEAAGVHRVMIADIEAGRKSGSVETVKRLASALGISMDDLV